MKLNIGGSTPAADWKNMHPSGSADVDYKGDFGNLGQFSNDSFDIIYSYRLYRMNHLRTDRDSQSRPYNRHRHSRLGAYFSNRPLELIHQYLIS